MKNIYIFDDSKYKIERITRYMKSLFPNATIYEYTYINEGLRDIFTKHNEISGNPTENLFIIDMVIPLLSDTIPDAKGGIHIIRQLDRRKISSPAIVASSESLDTDMIKEEARIKYLHFLGTVVEDSSVYTLPLYEKLLKEELNK